MATDTDIATPGLEGGRLPDLATRRQVAEYTQISYPTLSRWAMEGQGPKFVRLGGSVRYRRADVLSWLDAMATVQ